MSRTTITLPSILLDELMSEIKAKSKTDAVITAIRDEIRLKKQERIKTMAGDMEYDVRRPAAAWRQTPWIRYWSIRRHGSSSFGRKSPGIAQFPG